MEIDEYNTIRFSLDINKLLVPTPPVRSDSTDDNGDYIIIAGMDDNVSVAKGMIQSFYDAPEGFSEEMKEFIWVVGTEYWYNKQFALSAGYFHESKMKGNRKVFHIGCRASLQCIWT